MKATGVVRRIDDLGRIVIPKEIRKTMRIKEGESLEIFIDNTNIILKKYSALDKISEYAQNITEAIHSITKNEVFITDTNNIIAVSGQLKRKYINKNISNYLLSIIKNRENKIEKGIKNIEFIDDLAEKGSYIINSINVNGDILGLIIVFTEENELNEKDEQMLKIVSNFLSKQLQD